VQSVGPGDFATTLTRVRCDSLAGLKPDAYERQSQERTASEGRSLQRQEKARRNPRGPPQKRPLHRLGIGL